MATFSGTTPYTVNAAAAAFTGTTPYDVVAAAGGVTGSTPYTVVASGSAIVDGATAYVVATAPDPVQTFRVVAGALVPVQLGQRVGSSIVWLSPPV